MKTQIVISASRYRETDSILSSSKISEELIACFHPVNIVLFCVKYIGIKDVQVYQLGEITFLFRDCAFFLLIKCLMYFKLISLMILLIYQVIKHSGIWGQFLCLRWNQLLSRYRRNDALNCWPRHNSSDPPSISCQHFWLLSTHL